MEKLLSEQAERRKHPQLSPPGEAGRQAGQQETSPAPYGVGASRAASEYGTQPALGTIAGVDGPGVGAVGGHGKSPRSVGPGGGSPDCEADHPEDNRRDRREGGEAAEGYVKEGASSNRLVAFIESQFDCRNGNYGHSTEHNGEQLPYITLVYITRVMRTKNPKIQEISDNSALEVCRNALLGDFIAIRNQFPAMPKPTLYWRFHESMRICDEIHGGRKRMAKVRTRIAIPGAIFEKILSVTPEGQPAREI